MLGAIIGDIVGSRFEWNNIKTKKFDFWSDKCFFTDDSVMTIAVLDAIVKSKNNYGNLYNQTIKSMQEIGQRYMNCGYGGRFIMWMQSKNPKPYNSFGNGAAMRVSFCGFVGKNIDEVKYLSNEVTRTTHNHIEGLKGAEATAVAIYLAKNGINKNDIKKYIIDDYYKIDWTLDDIRDTYTFNETCQGTVPQALECFFESNSFEDAIRNAISLGGDSDTLAAITGAIADAFYGDIKEYEDKALDYLDNYLRNILFTCIDIIK